MILATLDRVQGIICLASALDAQRHLGMTAPKERVSGRTGMGKMAVHAGKASGTIVTGGT